MGYHKTKLDCASVCSDAWSRATSLEVMITRHHMILRDKNSVLILCIIQVAVVFGQGNTFRSDFSQKKIDVGWHLLYDLRLDDLWNTSYLKFTQIYHPAQPVCRSSWVASQNGFHWILDITSYCARPPNVQVHTDRTNVPGWLQMQKFPSSKVCLKSLL